MEDALISPMGFMILSGAGLLEASEENKIKVHATEITNMISGNGETVSVGIKEKPYFVLENGKTSDEINLFAEEVYNLNNTSKENYIYVMNLDNGEVCSEPYIPESITYKRDKNGTVLLDNTVNNLLEFTISSNAPHLGSYSIIEDVYDYIREVDESMSFHCHNFHTTNLKDYNLSLKEIEIDIP